MKVIDLIVELAKFPMSSEVDSAIIDDVLHIVIWRVGVTELPTKRGRYGISIVRWAVGAQHE